MLTVGDEEGVHGAGGLQARDGGGEVEGFAGTEGNEVFGAVHDAGDEDTVAEAEVFEVGGFLGVLGGRGLRAIDAGKAVAVVGFQRERNDSPARCTAANSVSAKTESETGVSIAATGLALLIFPTVNQELDLKQAVHW